MTKNERIYLDDLWIILVKLRDTCVCRFPQCCYCNNIPFISYLQSHHIFRKSRNWAVRYDILNGITTCKSRHFAFYGETDPAIQSKVISFYKSLLDKNGNSIYDYLEIKRHNQVKLDYNLILIDLSIQIKKQFEKYDVFIENHNQIISEFKKLVKLHKGD